MNEATTTLTRAGWFSGLTFSAWIEQLAGELIGMDAARREGSLIYNA